jgi:hypothetical protein
MYQEDPLKQQALADILGKSWKEAEQIFKDKYPKFNIRYNWKEGESFIITKDIDDDRLTVGIENGVVVDKYNTRTDDQGRKFYWMAEWG